MSTALFLALHLVAGQANVEVETRHAVVELDGNAYLHLPKGARLRAKVKRAFAGEKLSLDVVRVGSAAGRPDGAATLRVKVGGRSRTVRARPPLERSRKVPGDRLASYPVRHRFRLPSETTTVVVEVREGDDGVLVFLQGQAPKKGRAPALVPLAPVAKDTTEQGRSPALVPLAPLAKKAPKKARPTRSRVSRARGDPKPKPRPPSDAPTVAAREAPSTPAEAPPVETPPVAAPPVETPPVEAPAVETPPVETPTAPPRPEEPKVAPPATAEAAPPVVAEVAPPVVAEAAPPAPSVDMPANAEAAPARAGAAATDDTDDTLLSLPVRLSAQVSAGGAFQLSGGLTPAVLGGGVRAVVGARSGWLSRYAFGVGLDFDQQSAAAREGTPLRWDVTETRVRLEAQARLLEHDLGAVAVDLTLLAGVGAVLGGHGFTVGDRHESALLFGPTARVAVASGLRLGPGALTVTLPADVSVDTAGQTSGFAPIAAGLFVGYRLDL